MGKKVMLEGSELMKMIMVVLMLTITVSFVDGVSKKPDMYRVGDSDKGWRPQLNYTDWASKHHFYVGDWLYFGYQRNMYDVLEVSKKDYRTCSSDHPIANISRGAGRDVFNLTSAKAFYFLSSGGFCFQGMRVAVLVEEFSGSNSTDLAPFPSNNGSSMVSGRNVMFILIGAIVVAWTSVLNV